MASSAKPFWRFRPQFGLRALLVLMAACCLFFLLLALKMARVRDQANAIEAIRKLHGEVHFLEQPGTTPEPAWLRRALGEDFFRTVQTVDFATGSGARFKAESSMVDDDDLAWLAKLPDVETLELANNQAVTDAGLAHLAGLKNLRVLYLHRTRVTGVGLSAVAESLRTLSLSYSPVTDEGLAPLRAAGRLRNLQLKSTRIGDQGLAHLAAIKSLESLQLSNTDITDDGLPSLAALTGLQQLSLRGTLVTAAGVADLQRALPNCEIRPTAEELSRKPQDVALWPDGTHPARAELLAIIKELGGEVTVDKSRPGEPITRLMLFDSPISDVCLARIVAEMPEVQQLNLRNLLVGDEFLRRLPALPKLSFLHLLGSRITDAGVEHLGRFPALRTLEIDETRISDQALPALKRLPLDELDVGETRISVEGMQELKRALPQCQVRG